MLGGEEEGSEVGGERGAACLHTQVCVERGVRREKREINVVCWCCLRRTSAWK